MPITPESKDSLYHKFLCHGALSRLLKKENIGTWNQICHAEGASFGSMGKERLSGCTDEAHAGTADITVENHLAGCRVVVHCHLTV